MAAGREAKAIEENLCVTVASITEERYKLITSGGEIIFLILKKVSSYLLQILNFNGGRKRNFINRRESLCYRDVNNWRGN